jgi:signal transduction histidine kinase
MYAEMLAGGMVPQAERRQQYLETLRVEADRLSHLVENVLQYARLERGRTSGGRSHRQREKLLIETLIERCQTRLADRADQSGMKLALELSDAARNATVDTDCAAVEQILFNLVDNACKYAAAAADKRIHLSVDVMGKKIALTVRDHGQGISAAGKRRLFRPFSKSVHEAACTAPGVGLGLALSRRLAHDLGGQLELHSPGDAGAAFVLTLPGG